MLVCEVCECIARVYMSVCSQCIQALHILVHMGVHAMSVYAPYT